MLSVLWKRSLFRCHELRKRQEIIGTQFIVYYVVFLFVFVLLLLFFVLFCFCFCYFFSWAATNTDDYVLLDSVVFDYFRGNLEYSTMTMTVIYF